MFRTLFSVLSAVHITVPTAAAQADWQRVAVTGAGCPFTAAFDVLPDYPFARLTLEGDGAQRLIPLVVVSRSGCESIRYQEVPDATASLPTVEAIGFALCQGRLPYYQVTVSWSGVQHVCIME